MKPVLKTIKVQYWSCGDDSHNHKDKASAHRCIVQKERKSKYLIVWTDEKLSEILKFHADGESKFELSKRYDVSIVRINQVLWKANKKAVEISQKQNEPIKDFDIFDLLTVRATNCLKSAEIYTLDEIRDAITNGKLKQIPNLGKKSINEIIEAVTEFDEYKKISTA